MTVVEPRRGVMPSGVGFALLSAVLFGISTPCAKWLLGDIPPLLLAGLLYAGSGLGLFVIRLWVPAPTAEAQFTRSDVPWLLGITVTGGVLGPVLLMSGLRATNASGASLLLNLEGVFTALLAWFVFRENFDWRIALGFALIMAGALLLSWDGGPARRLDLSAGSLAIVAACLCWAVDNNLTRKVSGADPLRLAAIKGGAAGAVNLGLSAVVGARWPPAGLVGGALIVGFLGYGLSLVLFIRALRHLGAARTSAYFSLAPFFGAAVALIALREAIGPALIGSGALMAVGVWLHLTEHHDHEHHHERLVHVHRHVHDEHHRHAHPPGIADGASHTHEHVHEPVTHTHPHYPDIHHRHRTH